MDNATKLLKRSLPILEKLEQDYVDGKVSQELNGWGRPIDPSAVTLTEQFIQISQLIKGVRSHIKLAKKVDAENKQEPS